MKMRLQSVPACLFLMGALSGCGSAAFSIGEIRPQAKIAAEQKPADKELADLPDVIGLKAGGYGPHIMIWVNGNLYVDTTLRDSEIVAADQLGNYLSRIAFSDTKKIRIKADDADAKKAKLQAKFELSLFVNRGKSDPAAVPVLKMSFNEMRLAQSRSDPKIWFLTAEGIELIEKQIPEKK
jgi:hypothetical protein